MVDLRQINDRTLEAVLTINAPAPLEQWSARLGDAVHNFRAALDAAVWAMATFDGKEPDHPTSVAHPVFTDPKDWSPFLKRVALDPAFAQRLKSRQPFERADELAAAGQVDTLVVLHKLDVDDKHRNAVLLSIQPHMQADAVFIRGDPSQLTIEPIELGGVFETGSVVATMASPEPFELLHADPIAVEVRPQVMFGGSVAPIENLTATFEGFVRGSLDILYGLREEVEPDSVTLLDFGVSPEPGHL
jgi:hypothetical protein